MHISVIWWDYIGMNSGNIEMNYVYYKSGRVITSVK